MAGTSAQAGYLTPAANPAPLQDDAFDTFIHDVLAGISGLAGDKVRPAWQPEPPTQPGRDTDWLAFAISTMDADFNGVEVHHPDGDGHTDLQRHETVEVLISSYGPNAARTLAELRDGFQVEQNRSVLTANGMGFQETGSMRRAPSLVKDKWLNRYDMPFIFRRIIRRTYVVYNLASARGVLHTEVMSTDLIVEQPEP